MQNNILLYMIPVGAVLAIALVGFLYGRRAAARYSQMPPAPPRPQLRERIYEAPGVSQQSEHPLGAVQSVIRGRIRFVPTGLLFMGVGLFALYVLHFTHWDFYLERTPVNKLVGTVLFLGAILWGLQLISYAACRVKLRRTGFEVCSALGTKACEYKDATFHLARTIEHKHDSAGYRPVFQKSGNYNHIWQCQIIFQDDRKPLVLKSSRYARLKSKMTDLLHALEDVPAQDAPAGDVPIGDVPTGELAGTNS